MSDIKFQTVLTDKEIETIFSQFRDIPYEQRDPGNKANTLIRLAEQAVIGKLEKDMLRSQEATILSQVKQARKHDEEMGKLMSANMEKEVHCDRLVMRVRELENTKQSTQYEYTPLQEQIRDLVKAGPAETTLNAVKRVVQEHSQLRFENFDLSREVDKKTMTPNTESVRATIIKEIHDVLDGGHDERTIDAAKRVVAQRDRLGEQVKRMKIVINSAY